MLNREDFFMQTERNPSPKSTIPKSKIQTAQVQTQEGPTFDSDDGNRLFLVSSSFALPLCKFGFSAVRFRYDTTINETKKASFKYLKAHSNAAGVSHISPHAVTEGSKTLHDYLELHQG